jgi:phosphatidylserine/phosphatidylglycerophosphate/cardiolipin synthase-like enzyme
MDNKLIEKVEGAYRHTALGEILCNIGLSMEKLLLDKDKLKIMSQLSKVKNLSEKQKNELMQFFSIDLSLGSKDVKIIDSFDELVSVTVDIFNNATEMVYIATQYIDVRVINAGFKALERGVKMRGLISEIDQISNALKIAFSILTNPRQISVIRNFLSSANSQARTVKLHYTFIIADGKRSVMEIKDPFVDEFKFAICINSEKISKKLVEVFESYWNQGKEILNNIKI